MSEIRMVDLHHRNAVNMICHHATFFAVLNCTPDEIGGTLDLGVFRVRVRVRRRRRRRDFL